MMAWAMATRIDCSCHKQCRGLALGSPTAPARHNPTAHGLPTFPSGRSSCMLSVAPCVQSQRDRSSNLFNTTAAAAAHSLASPRSALKPEHAFEEGSHLHAARVWPVVPAQDAQQGRAVGVAQARQLVVQPGAQGGGVALDRRGAAQHFERVQSAGRSRAGVETNNKRVGGWVGWGADAAVVDWGRAARRGMCTRGYV